MTLTLSVLRCPDAVPPETRTVRGGEFSIGRGPDNAWVLADPDRHLSKRHCVLAYRGGGWQLADTSTNGTFLNRDAEPVGDRPRDLRDGDRLRLGLYEIEIRIAEDAASAFGAPSGGSAFGAPSGGGRSVLDDPFGDDPFAPPAAPGAAANPFLEDNLLGGSSGFGGGSAALPADFDPLAPDAEDLAFGARTQGDHSPSTADAFRPPPVIAGAIPDDDWDLDFSAPAAPAPTAAPPPASAAPPVPLALLPEDDDDDPFAVPPAAVPPPAVAPPSVAASDPAAAPQPATVTVASPTPPPPRPSVAPTPAAPEPAVSEPAGSPPGGLMAAFLQGAAMPGAQPAEPAEAMRAIGAAFRALVAGLRQALIARAAVKGEFRIEQTMIRARGNNPLKFSAGDDDALAALIGIGRRTDMAPAAAVADALRDMRLHELAVMAAMQTGVRALLARFDPAALREAASGGSLLPGGRGARAFEAFERLHGEVTQALADDFDSVFGKAFARAYEDALREAAAKEDPR